MKQVFSLFLFFIFYYSACALAQQDSTKLSDIYQSSIDELLNVSKEAKKLKVSTGTGSAESLAEIPSSITVFTREQIQAMGIEDVYELLNYVPGFQATRDISTGEFQRLHTRGQNGDTKILFLLNGQRLNESYSSRASLFNRVLSTSHVKQVEIIRGPGSSVFGSNAFLGVVNIVMDTENNDLVIKRGSQAGVRAAAGFSQNLNAYLKVATSIELYEDEGVDYDLGADGTKDPVSHQNFHLQLTNKDLTFSGSYMHVQATDFMFFGNLTGNGINRYNSTFWNANLDYNTNISETVNFTLQGAYSRFKQDGLGVGLPEGTPSPLDGQPINHAFIIGPYIISHDIQLSSRLNWQMHPKHNLFTGVDFRISGASDFDGYTNYLSADESLYFPANSLYINRIRLIKNFALFDDVEQFLSILGVFTQYKAMLAKNFTAFLGVRYDNYFKIAGTINPRIGLIYQTPFGATFKALYGSAFRAPVLSELYLNSPFDLANNQLKPEKISTFELIYLQKIKQTELSLTFFDNQSKNLIVTQGLPDGRSTSVNVTETRIGRGIEFASQVVLSAQFSAYLSYTYYLDTDGLEQNTFQQFAAAYFNFQGKKWAFNINGIFRPALTAALEDQKSYTLLNLKTKYQLNKKFGLSLVFLNLLDTKYQTPVRESSFGVPNRGIQWRVGLDFKFSR